MHSASSTSTQKTVKSSTTSKYWTLFVSHSDPHRVYRWLFRNSLLLYLSFRFSIFISHKSIRVASPFILIFLFIHLHTFCNLYSSRICLLFVSPLALVEAPFTAGSNKINFLPPRQIIIALFTFCFFDVSSRNSIILL